MFSLPPSLFSLLSVTPLEYAILTFLPDLLTRICSEYRGLLFHDDTGHVASLVRGKWNAPTTLLTLLDVAYPNSGHERKERIATIKNQLEQLQKQEKKRIKAQAVQPKTPSRPRPRSSTDMDAPAIFLHYHGAPGDDTSSILNKKVTCLICGVKRFQFNTPDLNDRSQDWNLCHIVAPADGGSDELWNVIPGCIDCNFIDKLKPQLEAMLSPANPEKRIPRRIVPLLHTLQRCNPHLKSLSSLEELVRDRYVAAGTEMSSKLRDWLRQHDQAARHVWAARTGSAHGFTAWWASTFTEDYAQFAVAAAAAGAAYPPLGLAAAAASSSAATAASASPDAAAATSRLAATPIQLPPLAPLAAAAQSSRKHARDDDAARAQSGSKRHGAENGAASAASTAAAATSLPSFCSGCGTKVDLRLACLCVKFCKHCGGPRLNFRAAQCDCGCAFER